MNMPVKADKFFDVPLKKFQTTQGVVDLPILYQDYGYAHFLYWVDHAAAAARLADTAFTPCKFIHGKAGVLLAMFNYRTCAIGPYNEVGLAILCHPKKQVRAGPFMTQFLKDAVKWTMGAYVINLPVTTEIACAGGREIWSYPKFVTRIDWELSGRRFRGAVYDPELKEPLVTVEGKMGLVGSPLKVTPGSFISHTTHKGVPLRTLTAVESPHGVRLGFSGPLRVNERSKHLMARNLLDLGMQGKRPFLSLYSAKNRMILYDGVPLAPELR